MRDILPGTTARNLSLNEIMNKRKPINLFYSEPDPDRWFKYDRYPRRLIRRIIRGKQKPGGVMLVAINLMRGFDKLGVPYRFNDYSYIQKHENEIACIIGKPNVLFDNKWKNPIIFGAGIFSHPVERPDIFKEFPTLKLVLVPGQWMLSMFAPYYPSQVKSWAVGIDTDKWSDTAKKEPKFDFLIYDKVRWRHDEFEIDLINPIYQLLDKYSLSHQTIRYGSYEPQNLLEKLKHTKAVIFLCEHETQGQAYQQILATNTPILAWDRGGYWQDPYYYPTKVLYQPVSSVPYWDYRCGLKFNGIEDFETILMRFLDQRAQFEPRNFILENLTLEKSAQNYLDIFMEVEKTIG